MRKKVFGYQELPGVTKTGRRASKGRAERTALRVERKNVEAPPSRVVGRGTGFALAPSLVLTGRPGVIQNNRLIREPPEIDRGHKVLIFLSITTWVIGQRRSKRRARVGVNGAYCDFA